MAVEQESQRRFLMGVLYQQGIVINYHCGRQRHQIAVTAAIYCRIALLSFCNKLTDL